MTNHVAEPGAAHHGSGPEVSEDYDKAWNALVSISKDGSRDRQEIARDVLAELADPQPRYTLEEEIKPADLTRWILDALERPADDPSDRESFYMQKRIEAAIRGWLTPSKGETE